MANKTFESNEILYADDLNQLEVSLPKNLADGELVDLPLAFANAPNTGLYRRNSDGAMSILVGGVDILDLLGNAATISGNLTVHGNLVLDGRSVVIGGNLTIANAATFGSVVVNRTLAVTGNTSVSNLSASGSTSVVGLAVSGSETISGTLAVTGNTSVSNLSASGSTSAVGLAVSGNATVGGNLTVSGTVLSSLPFASLPSEVQVSLAQASVPGLPPVATNLVICPIIQNTQVPANFSGSAGFCFTKSTSQFNVIVAYNHANVATNIGNISFISSSNIATMTTQGAVNLVNGDVLYMTTQAVADSTLSDIGITLKLLKQ